MMIYKCSCSNAKVFRSVISTINFYLENYENGEVFVSVIRKTYSTHTNMVKNLLSEYYDGKVEDVITIIIQRLMIILY